MSVISQDGWSSLMVAAYQGKTEIVVELVKAGAKLNLQNTVCQYLMSLVHDVQSIDLHRYNGSSAYSCVIHNIILSVRKGTQQ